MARTCLKAFSIRNYRTIREATLDFTHGAIGLIGVNASGKTNVGRALLFLCDQIKSSLPQIGGPSQANTELSNAEWNPLQNIDPAALLFRPEAGQEIELSVTLDMPAFFIPANQGHILRQIDRSSESYEIEIAATFRATNLPTGALSLVPSYQIRIAGRDIARADVQQLQGFWKTVAASRLQALRPAQEFLTAMNNLRNKSVAGHNAFDRLNSSVLTLESNFARVSFVNNNPMAIEGDISDLTVDNMSTGNLRALQLLSVSRNPELADALLIHIEEPETHFHPSLQRDVIRVVLDNCRQQNMAVILETHSAQVLRELYANNVPVYRVDVAERDAEAGTRSSVVTELPHSGKAVDFLAQMGIDVGFALLGGVTVITDGVTDPPAYRAFFSRFDDLRESLICFIPIGCLESHGLDLSGIASLSSTVILLADGHFREQHGERLQQLCSDAGVQFIQLDHWGVENFFTERALRAAAEDTPQIEIGDDLALDPMTSLRETPGIAGFSKNHHMARVAAQVTKEELEQQPDFMRVVEALRESGRVQQ